MTRVFAALVALCAAATAAAQDDPWYFPADEGLGRAVVKWAPVAAACPDEDDVPALDAAMRGENMMEAERLIKMKGCIPLWEGSHGEIIGASAAPTVLHVKMRYMPNYPEETPDDGPELFVQVTDLATISDATTQPWGIWRELVGRE